jgi:hypothetical protein
VNLARANRAPIRIVTADWSQKTNPSNSVLGHYREVWNAGIVLHHLFRISMLNPGLERTIVCSERLAA